MGGKLARSRGLNFEREIANKLKEVFPDAKRKLEYQWQAATGVDLENTGKLKIQCKRSKTTIPMRKIKEIKEEGIHLLVSKKDREDIFVTMYFEDFIKIIKDIGEVYG